MARRPPARPPQIAGYSYEGPLGSGGFSDVFLYRQHLPQRQVAVKVLLAHAQGEDGRSQFVAEANLMARLSTHPAIVTIHHADTAADGRPFLVMEYCARPALSARYRTERIAVAEAIRIGIRLAGAVETAHRAGILHRDIKPANVLTTDYGWPALTDFGISVAANLADAEESVGMSIPWAAPEFFHDSSERGVRGDVYSLAATIYTLLAGRSPFEQVGGPNSALDLITRIERSPVPPIGRPDVPASLESVLTRAMAKRPDARYASAVAFARALQRVEAELHLSQTSIDIPDTSWAIGQPGGAEELRTRARAVASIPARPSSLDQTGPDGIARGAEAQGSRPGGDEDGSEPAGTGRRWLPRLAGAAVVLLVGAVVVVGALSRSEPQTETTSATLATAPESTPDTAGLPPAPQEVLGERIDEQTVVFTWTEPAWDGDLGYVWRLQGENRRDERLIEPRLELTDQPGTVCVEISSVSEGGQLSQRWSSACVA